MIWPADRSPAGAPFGTAGPLATFASLVLLLSSPFWLAAELWQLELLPGLPVSAMMAICPAAAAWILRPENPRALFGAACDIDRIRSPLWLTVGLVLMPALAVASHLLLTAFGASPPPFRFQPLAAAGMAFAFLVGAGLEELGWSRYAVKVAAGRLSELRLGGLLGITTALWHVVPYLQADRSWNWILWQCLFTVAFRLILLRLYIGSGRSLCAVVLCHASANLAVFMSPVAGSHYSPALMFALTFAAALLMTRRSGSPPAEVG